MKKTDVDSALMGGSTYRSLGEQRLSKQDERKGRRTVGLLLAPVVAVVFLLLPLDIPPQRQTLAGVLLGVIVLWVTEPIPIPIGGLLGVAVIVSSASRPSTMCWGTSDRRPYSRSLQWLDGI